MFNTSIPFYSLMILLSLFSNIIIVLLLYKKFDFSFDQIIGALIYENIGIIFGAKILTFIQNYQQYGNFDFFNLGLSAYGGIIGALTALIIFSWQFKKSFKDLLFVFMPSIPLMYALGKIGCFLVGCCHGIKYSGIGSIIYNYSPVAPKKVPLFPIQIVETIVFIFIFIFIFNKILKNEFKKKTLGISFILCGFSKFFLDFLRMSHIGILLSLNQKISVIFILIGLVLIVRKKTFSICYNKLRKDD